MKKLFFLVLVVLCGLNSCTKDHILSYDAQLQKDVATIDTYLSAHSITATQDGSGLRYTVSKVGSGLKPSIGGLISVKYSARLLDSTIPFDQDTVGINLILAQNLIQAWQIGLPLMTKGSVFTLYVPSGLGYGVGGSGSTVPGNANIVFDITLLDDDAQLAKDIALIDSYLYDSLHTNPDLVTSDPSGVRFLYTTEGTGIKPIATSNITITYEGWVLNTKATPFVNNTASSTTEALSNTLLGWQIALLQIPTGSNFTLYIPSTLAYGPGGYGTIGSNANLRFAVNLISTN